MSLNTIRLLIFLVILIIVIIFSIYGLINNKGYISKNKNKKVHNQKGIINKLNNVDFIQNNNVFTNKSKMEIMFNRAKNPWHMSIATFQFIRYGGTVLFLILLIIELITINNINLTIILALITGVCFTYPVYYYTATGNEREAEWNKFYEFVWVLKHNLMLYDPAKAYINTKIYIQEHAPHDKEIIQGFNDFYNYWHDDYIDEYIKKYYDFSVTREITQIVFNMKQTGDFPEESLNSLRTFIINAQDLTVEKTLSTVSGKATIFSLPFMMISVIIGLGVPLILQIMAMM